MTPETPRPLGYSDTGENRRPAVLFLHGFLGSSNDWLAVTAALEGRYRCIAGDLPGHGASTDLPPEAYTVEGTAQALLGLLDSLGLERPVIAGYSMGGRLALYLALRRPDRLSGLFLESASPGLKDEEERASRRAADEEKAARLESGNFEEFLRDWYRQPLFAPLARNEGLLQRTLEVRRENDPCELAKSLRGVGTGSQPSLWGELSGLQIQALAVAGGLDERFVGISRRMGRACPQMRTAVVPHVGHNVRAEAPAAYVRLLRDFLDGHPVRTRPL